MTDAEARTRYWRLVAECLIRFHGRSPQQAEQEWRFMAAIFDRGADRNLSLSYHIDPFYVAFDIAHPEQDYVDRLEDANRCYEAQRVAYREMRRTVESQPLT